MKRRRLAMFAVAVAVCAAVVAWAVDTGYILVTLGENVNDASNAWVNPTNIYTSNDVYSTSTESPETTSDKLRATMSTNPFDIQASATINGIIARYERHCDAVTAVATTYVSLTNGGSLIGTTKTFPGDWETVDTLKTAGTSVDTWTASPTPTIVNSTTFGACLWADWAAEAAPGSGSMHVDAFEMRVVYTPGAAAPGQLPVVGVGLLSALEPGDYSLGDGRRMQVRRASVFRWPF